MNAARFDQLLTTALGGESQVSPPSDIERQAATLRAVAEYSRWRPALRRYGTGFLVDPVPAGADSVQVSGGLWEAGEQVKIGMETATVQEAEIGGTSFAATVPVVTLKLTAPLASPKRTGTTVTQQPGAVGLRFVADQDLYPLPPDWIGAQPGGIEEALGLGTGRKTDTFASPFPASGRLSGTGFGRSVGFGSGYGAARYDGIGRVVGEVYGGGAGGGEPYRILPGGETPLLLLGEAPRIGRRAELFYKGIHSIESVPQQDEDVVLSYARYALFSSRAAGFGGDLKWSEEGVSEDPTASAAALGKLATMALTEFESRIRHVPYVTSG